MERAVTGFHADDLGDWVAELSCGHDQHVRHRPPFHTRPWVLEESSRSERIGAPLDCPLCDAGELPAAVRLVRHGARWDEASLPAGLLRDHRLGGATWGVVHVASGRLRLTMDDPRSSTVLEAGSSRAIPPDAVHSVEPLGPVVLLIDFYAVDRTARRGDGGDADRAVPAHGQGGDPACWAHLVCPECGAVLDGGPHPPGCA